MYPYAQSFAKLLFVALRFSHINLTEKNELSNKRETFLFCIGITHKYSPIPFSTIKNPNTVSNLQYSSTKNRMGLFLKKDYS